MLGKVVEGSENLNRVLREQLPATAPAAFVQAQERAKKRLPKSVYKALLAGSEKGVTYADNLAAFAELVGLEQQTAWRVLGGFGNCHWAVVEQGRSGWRITQWNASAEGL